MRRRQVVTAVMVTTVVAGVMGLGAIAAIVGMIIASMAGAR